MGLGGSVCQLAVCAMKFNLDDLKKLESSSVTPDVAIGDGPFAAIVEVKEDDYVPKGLKVRAQIGPKMFTCEVTRQQMATLEKDSRVASIALNKKFRSAI